MFGNRIPRSIIIPRTSSAPVQVLQQQALPVANTTRRWQLHVQRFERGANRIAAALNQRMPNGLGRALSNHFRAAGQAVNALSGRPSSDSTVSSASQLSDVSHMTNNERNTIR
ncbi:MAG: hypothetical protein ACJAUP_000537 [Cellvibrionaceae bacterium]|jgi:hypothetical protein